MDVKGWEMNGIKIHRINRKKEEESKERRKEERKKKEERIEGVSLSPLRPA